MDAQSVTIPLVFLAGMLSFISPCVLPLVPAYIGYLTGQAANTASNSLSAASVGADGGGAAAAVQVQPSRFVVFLHGVFFVIGFSLIFILLGIGVGALGQLGRSVLVARDWITGVGGLLIIILGLHTMGVIRIPFLYYDTRKQEAPKQELGFVGSMLMGVTFSAGWSPCVGPILGTVLTLGAATGSVGYAVILLATYALGLGIPFLLAALLLEQISGELRKLQKHMRTIEIVSGALMIVIGVLVFSGTVQWMSRFFQASSGLTLRLDDWLMSLMGSG
jgi:cytochrome c-type biogenesis protein